MTVLCDYCGKRLTQLEEKHFVGPDKWRCDSCEERRHLLSLGVGVKIRNSGKYETDLRVAEFKEGL